MARIKIGLIMVVVFMTLGIGGYLMFQKPKKLPELSRLSPRSGEISPSSEFLNAQRSVDRYREQIQSHPDLIKNYIELAQIYLQEARVTGRHHEYVPKAKYLLDEALSRDSENFDALILKSSLLMTLHQFEDAKQIAERAIARNAYSAFAYGVLCDALVELGNYDEAVKVADKMQSIRPDLRSYARVSYLRELHGDVRGAREAMKLAADAGLNGQESRSWVLYNLGNLYLSEGKLDTAQFIFRGILDERPNYAFALSGLAQVKKTEKQYAEAIELLVKAVQEEPEHIFLEQIANIYRAMGQYESEQAISKKVLEAFEQHKKEGWNIDMEYAIFCSNHGINLQDALTSAAREYHRRPANIDALETYAWTLYKNGRASEAAQYIDRAMRLNTHRATLYSHAAMIYKAVGDNVKSMSYQQRALVQNPFIQAFDPEIVFDKVDRSNAVAFNK